MKNYKSYEETKKQFSLPSWYYESVHTSVISILKENGLLHAVKYIKELGKLKATETLDPGLDMGLKGCKEVCDFINSCELPTLEEMLDKWQVHEPGTYDNDWSNDYHAVSNDKGIIAYFIVESDAHRFRLGEVNRELNG